MSTRFEQIDWQPTPIGDLSLRRRLEPTLQVDLYEVKLGDEYLMSSLFTVSEIELANLSLARLAGTDLDIVVGGLGLGYTARAVLEDPRVRSMHVIEALDAVIGWHQNHQLPLAAEMTSDPRCHLVNGDFFAIVAAQAGFGSQAPDRVHAILVDIDHTPRHHLHPSHAPFYTADGLRCLADRLHPGGVFALWSDDQPDSDYVATLREVFTTCEAHVITFPNPLTGDESSSTVYTATLPDHPLQTAPATEAPQPIGP